MRYARVTLTLAMLTALIVAGASAARANDGGYTWGMTVNPTPIQQSADIITAGTKFDYGHVGPNWVYVTPYLHVWDPNWAGPSCNTIRYHNGVEEGSQRIGAGAPSPYVWSLNMTAPVTWTITVTCPLPQGATGTPAIDVTFLSELPPASPSPVGIPVGPIPGGPLSPSPSAKPAGGGKAAPVAPAPAPPARPAPVRSTPSPAPSPLIQSLAASPVAAAQTPAPAPAPASASPVVTPSGKPTVAPSFEAVPRSAVTAPGRGFHPTFLELLAIGLLAVVLLAARRHWGWR